jgi:hypothetical protein
MSDYASSVLTRGWALDIEGGVECAHAAIERIDEELEAIRATMNDLEQAIYATVYGTRMEAFLRSGTWIGLVHRGDEEQCEQVLADHVATAKADARRAVELHRGE